jgi:hypothetical protein
MTHFFPIMHHKIFAGRISADAFYDANRKQWNNAVSTPPIFSPILFSAHLTIGTAEREAECEDVKCKAEKRVHETARAMRALEASLAQLQTQCAGSEAALR